MSLFIRAAQIKDTSTEKGAVAHSTTGASLVDQFATAGNFRNRPVIEVFTDQATIAGEDWEKALKFVFYLRMITRKLNGPFATQSVQRGQGTRDEAYKRFLWYLGFYPETFYKNLYLFLNIGCARDFWELLAYAKVLNMAVDYDRAFAVYDLLLADEATRDLALKYLPQIKSKAKCKTSRAQIRNKLATRYAKHLALVAKAYRQTKTMGKAHIWQQLISKQLYRQINFGHIPGRALSWISSTKLLENHGLVNRYTAWLAEQPVVPFTGYVYELGKRIEGYNVPLHTKMTVDKQFNGLVAQAKEGEQGAITGNVLACLDTSGSMTWISLTSGITPYQVCLSLGVFFSVLNTGAFRKVVCKFDNDARLVVLKGNSFTDMYHQARQIGAWGTTNFQSVIDLLVATRRRSPNIPVADYPDTLLIVSDMQFDPPGGSAETNWEATTRKLSAEFPPEYINRLKVLWWKIDDRATGNFPSNLDEAGTYLFSGFDGAIISLLLGGDVTDDGEKSMSMEELLHKALNQEVLQAVQP